LCRLAESFTSGRVSAAAILPDDSHYFWALVPEFFSLVPDMCMNSTDNLVFPLHAIFSVSTVEVLILPTLPFLTQVLEADWFIECDYDL
jgi:hypothetical protein